MSPTAVTAFDPMFWFHHANVDRQLALYQAVFPDTYMGSCASDTPTFTVERGEILTANSGRFFLFDIIQRLLCSSCVAYTDAS